MMTWAFINISTLIKSNISFIRFIVFSSPNWIDDSNLNKFKETGKSNYLLCLNCSRDTGKDYFSIFDIRNIIKNNIDYTIGNSFYIKNIDKYVINGEILTLNRNINRFHAKDIKKLNSIANALIKEEGISE